MGSRLSEEYGDTGHLIFLNNGGLATFVHHGRLDPAFASLSLAPELWSLHPKVTIHPYAVVLESVFTLSSTDPLQLLSFNMLTADWGMFPAKVDGLLNLPLKERDEKLSSVFLQASCRSIPLIKPTVGQKRTLNFKGR